MKYLEVFLTALKLGLTSFGGPIAHLSYFREEYVKKRKWLSEQAYADLVALCQFLPGPASSQVGMAIGLSRAGVGGAILAWLGFTLPSALVLGFVGVSLRHLDLTRYQSLIHNLKIVAVAVVAHAVWNMGKKLCPDFTRASIAILSALFVINSQSVMSQIIAILAAGLFGAYFLKQGAPLPHEPLHSGGRRSGFIYLSIFTLLIFAFPILRTMTSSQTLNLLDSFYRAGSLVFGGGHVILPLLQAEVVQPGWVTPDLFMAGYGLANAIPGPLFALSSYLGAVSAVSPNGWTGALLCLTAAFLPSFLLVMGVLPFWEKLRELPRLRKSMLGINASVVGILLAALYAPVWTSAIFSLKDFLWATACFLLLEKWQTPSWVIVFISMIASFFTI